MDVVKIKNPQIQLKHSASSDNRYRPEVSSPFHLNISAKYSEVNICFEAQEKYDCLIHIPTKFNQYYNLVDIINNGQNIDGEHVNLLVGLKSLGIPQNITTKDGRNLRKVNLTVFDQTYSSFIITIWDDAVIHFAQKWNQSNCVLFISDIKVNYNKHMKQMIGTVDGLTVFTPNPEIQEAYSFYKYAQMVEFEIQKYNDPYNEKTNLHQSSVYVIEEIQKILAMGCDISLSGDIQGVVFALISKLDLDGFSRITSFRCEQCKQRLVSQERNCNNMKCNMGNGTELTINEEIFDINIWLSDYSGTLKKCFLNDEIAQKLLNCTVEEYSYLSETEKTNMKWKFLLEWCKIYFKIVASSSGNPSFYIISCQISNVDEFVKHTV
ncbi:meiosis-specific with OB domain-containing protein isoform X2 [Centruroides vittatus]